MDQKQKVGSAHYRKVDGAYFEKRVLKKYARAFHLWALGVGAVISGDFFGWNFGLSAAGFGGMLFATVVITALYVGLCFSIAEMAAALPHTGGAYSFSRSSMGPWGGYITGLAENMEYILTPAVIVAGIGGYLTAVFGTPEAWKPFWWIGVYIIFIGLNIWGVELSFKFSVFITFLALLILAVFYVGAIGHFSFTENALNIVPDPGESQWFPKGKLAIFSALPFAMWFYLAIEQLPLAAEEAHDPQKDMPKGILLGLGTLIVLSFLTLFLNTGIAPGAEELGKTDEPLFEGFKTIFGSGLSSKLLALIAVAGLVASFHTIIYAYGRQIYSLSRAGYFPEFLSLTHGKRQTPHVALIVGGLIGLAATFVIHYSSQGSGSSVGAALLNMAVFGAVISYCLQMVAYLILKYSAPDIERPYKSPFGAFGAWTALLISAVTLVALFLEVSYRSAVIGAAIWFILGVVYFGIHGRKGLILAPEEEFALERSKSKPGRTEDAAD